MTPAHRTPTVSCSSAGRSTGPRSRGSCCSSASSCRRSSAIEHLAGMQAQAPHAPYVGLWTRLSGFRARGAVRADRHAQAVRGAADARDPPPRQRRRLPRVPPGRPARPRARLRRLAVRYRGRRDRSAARGRPGADRAAPRGPAPSSAALLAERWPEVDPASLAQAITYLVPAVQVPPRGIWGKSGQARWTTAEAWLGRELDPHPSRERLVIRYLAAFGPATVRDMQTWSGLTRLGEVVDRLRPELTHVPRRATAPSCSTSRTRRGPAPTTPAPRGSCPSTTTCCSPTPTARASSRAAKPCRSSPEWVRATGRCSSTACSAPRGGSPATNSAPILTSSRSSGCRARDAIAVARRARRWCASQSRERPATTCASRPRGSGRA